MADERRGKLVVIEGTDASGKKTQFELLVERLGRSMSVRGFDFPAYDTPFGRLVEMYLHGEFGPMDPLPPEIPSMLFAMDRYQFREELYSALATNDLVLANRYVQSNMGYQAARFPEPSRRNEFIRWLEALESGLPSSDLVIFLHVDLEISRHLMAGRGGTRDIHESDPRFQRAVSELYGELARERDEWELIDCTDPEGSGILPVERIHGMIMEVLVSRGMIPGR